MSGAILWFTGLSGAGKSTLAAAVGAHMKGARAVEVLDSDELRTHLWPDLGFSKEDRAINIRRVGFVARLLARHGVFVIAAAISPYADARNEIRRLAHDEGIPFIEVFVTAQLQSLLKRDVKGLYKRALSGEIAHFAGVSDPYEPPANPELVLHTDTEPVEASVEAILRVLATRGLAPHGS